MHKEKDIAIVERVLSGDASAFSRLVDQYKRMAFTLALRITRNREDAEEVAQDAFLKAYKNLNQFRKESKFSTWLYRIVYTTAISATRGKKLETESVDQEDHIEYSTINDAEKNLKEQDRTHHLELALNQMSPEDALLITLYYKEENSVEEIGDIMELSVSNVKVRLHRGRKKLYDELKFLLQDETKGLL